jgi:hypothetical protein
MVRQEESEQEGMGEIAEREGTPSGYAWVRVTTGLTDGDFVEVKSGLISGVEVAYTPPVASSGNQGMTFINGMAVPGVGPGAQGGPPVIRQEIRGGG